MKIPTLPWSSRGLSIRLAYLPNAPLGSRIWCSLIGEACRFPKPSETFSVTAVGHSEFFAFNEALRKYLDQNGNYEAIRHDSIQFHEVFGYVLVPCSDCASTGRWEYVPKPAK